MQEYDVALKVLLRGSARLTMRELTGTAVENWLDVELPKVQNTRVDLLGETSEGSLVHLELQSGNDATMPLRMAEYCLSVFRVRGKFPRQVMVYVGEAPLRMESELRGPDVWFRYRAIDIRELDGDRLLESEEVGDNVIAILTRLRDHQGCGPPDCGEDRRFSGGRPGDSAGPIADPGRIAAPGRSRGTGGAKDANSQRHPGQQSPGARV